MQERVQCEIVEYTFSSCYNSALEFAEKTVHYSFPHIIHFLSGV